MAAAMDISRAPHNAQARLKIALTPIWDAEMGFRLRVARERQFRTQAEMAALLTTPGRPVSQQQIAAIEHGRLEWIPVTWGRLEAALGKHVGYVLIGKDKALYDPIVIGRKYYEHTQKTRRRNASPLRKSRHGG